MKMIIVIVVFLLATALFPQKTFAATLSYAESSAKLAPITSLTSAGTDLRVKALENIFTKYNSPLVPYAKDYVLYADKYGIDWKLLPSIAGIESTFGRYMIPGSHNAYGWGGGYIYFNSWEEGIEHINKSLRENYIDRGAKTVYEVGSIYAEASHWPSKVSLFMDEIAGEYISISSSLTPAI